jgi:methylmalonyl-CoA/ethylmalonyl-CoA epimerase
MKLHHVGLVVPNIKDSLGELIKFLNFETITLPTLIGSQKVNVCFLQIGESYLELIEPASPDSPVINFVNKGGGFQVKDIHKELDILKEKGAKIIVEPVKGFEDRIVAFVMLTMKNTKCNLIELAEEKKNSN